MCSSKIISTLWPLVIYPIFLTETVLAWNKNVPVEPFVNDWCYQQYTEQLRSTIGKREQRVPIEPFIGEWCFEQFTEEFSHIDKDDAIDALYTSHNRIEDQLFLWGQDSIAAASQPDNGYVEVEPYMGLWCASQWSKEIEDNNNNNNETTINVTTVFDPVARLREIEQVPIETAFGRWCHETYPIALNDAALVDQNNTTEQNNITTNNNNNADLSYDEQQLDVYAEIYLLNWFYSYEKSQRLTVIEVIAFALFVFTICFIFYFCHRRRLNSQDAQIQYQAEKTLNALDKFEIGNMEDTELL